MHKKTATINRSIEAFVYDRDLKSFYSASAADPGFHIADLHRSLQEDFYGFPMIEGITE